MRWLSAQAGKKETTTTTTTCSTADNQINLSGQDPAQAGLNAVLPITCPPSHPHFCTPPEFCPETQDPTRPNRTPTETTQRPNKNPPCPPTPLHSCTCLKPTQRPKPQDPTTHLVHHAVHLHRVWLSTALPDGHARQQRLGEEHLLHTQTQTQAQAHTHRHRHRRGEAVSPLAPHHSCRGLSRPIRLAGQECSASANSPDKPLAGCLVQTSTPQGSGGLRFSQGVLGWGFAY